MGFVLTETIRIFTESAYYLLLGFALAGVLHVLLRRTPRFMNLLSGRGGKSVLLASLFGAPLPLCSCSVVPAALTLRRKGASKGATVSFLISVPETDIVSILLTYGLIGPVMAIVRPVAAIVTAIVTGQITNILDRRAEEASDKPTEEAGGCCCDPTPDASSPESCHSEEGGSEYRADKGVIWNIFHYGFVKFFDDIIGSLVFGMILGGLITALLPELRLQDLAGGSFLSMLAMLVVGIPMYVCATASTPIAAGLLVAGVSPGAALVFLLAGPATNVGSLIILGRQLGKRTLIVYLVCIAVISVLMGLWLDSAYEATELLPPPSTIAAMGGVPSLPKIVGAVVLLSLALMSFRRTAILSKFIERVGRMVGLHVRPGIVKAAVVVFVLVGYLASGLFIVGPGERGIVKTFGRIEQANLQPGLYYAWPYPIGEADVESIARIRTLQFGFRQAIDAPLSERPIEDGGENEGSELVRERSDLTEESWMLTGNEDIIDIEWVAKYRIRDTEDGRALRRYLYEIGDPEALIRSAAEVAIRVVAGRRSIDTLLTVDRAAVESSIQRGLQDTLDQCEAGVEIVYVGLQDVHAPKDVHWAFRDVASASEDKMKTINQAYEHEERVVMGAHGQSSQVRFASEGRAVELRENAYGETASFRCMEAEYRQHPDIMKMQMYFESMDLVLPGMKKYVCLSRDASEGMDLWLVKKGTTSLDLPILPKLDDNAR